MVDEEGHKSIYWRLAPNPITYKKLTPMLDIDKGYLRITFQSEAQNNSHTISAHIDDLPVVIRQLQEIYDQNKDKS